MNPTALLAADAAGSTNLTEGTPVVAHGIVSRTVLATRELRAVVFAFAADQALTEHTSTSRAMIQILTGEGEFTVAGQPHQLRSGDLLHLPPNVPHAVRAITPMTMLLTLAPERNGK